MLAALVAAPPSLAAQNATVTGRVVLGPGARPVVGRLVVLHRVTMEDGGPVDSTRTDAAGGWRLREAHVDTSAIYYASATHDSIVYFSTPIHPVIGQTTTADPIVLWDTSSTGPAILLRRRLITVTLPKPDGSRGVLEILELENPGRTTLVSNDTLHPTWTGAIPAQALRFQVQQSDFSSEVIAARAGQVRLYGPVQPQDSRQLAYGYVLPATVQSLLVPIDQPTEELDLLFQDTTTAVSAPGLAPLGVQTIEQGRFATYRVDSLAPGAQVRIAFSARQLRVEQLKPVIVGLMVLALGGGLWVALRRSQPSAVSSQQ